MQITCPDCGYTWTHRTKAYKPVFCNAVCEYRYLTREKAATRIAADRRTEFTSDYLQSLSPNN